MNEVICKHCKCSYHVANWKLRQGTTYCSNACKANGTRISKSRVCKVCSKGFEYTYGNKDTLVCSQKCKHEYLKTGTVEKCGVCEKTFYKQPHRATAKFCSKACLKVANTLTPVECICEYCHKKFGRHGYEVRRSGGKFCSVKCLCRANTASGKTLKRKNTAPEKEVQRILRDLNIKFVTNYRIRHDGQNKFYDIYIPSKNLLIEVDGVYWHAKGLKRSEMNATQLHNRKNDVVKNRIARVNGYKLVRIWENEITIKKVKGLL